ncbi:WXG100 family type VII secretion target [Bacillus sp. OK048]|uniref:WXG100 family type VII secretion target n=1 Tax=Bacillus sp. OK048 TaxID=1882761 RepID=UPI00088ECBF6|nr:WXG100 family type VII secretion target [Bacillus sp. OK048]SDM85065.1 Proteins of 100 residues with WXG [Bacillus sp. OK048]
MADLIKVDTGRVAAAAKNIANYNNRIKDDFSSVESAIRALNSVWDGTAAEHAMDSFYKIKSTFHEPRYTVVDNYVKFLQQQVDPGYTQAEKANTTLADLFK